MFEFNSMFDFISSIFSVSSILIFLFIFFIVIKGILHQQDISKKIDDDLSLNKEKEQVEEDNYEYKIMKCPNCGASLDDNLKVCNYCGSKLIKVKRK